MLRDDTTFAQYFRIFHQLVWGGTASLSINFPVDLHVDKKDSKPDSLIWWRVKNFAQVKNHMVFATPEMGTFQPIEHALFVALDSAHIAHGTVCTRPVPEGAIC